MLYFCFVYRRDYGFAYYFWGKNDSIYQNYKSGGFSSLAPHPPQRIPV